FAQQGKEIGDDLEALVELVRDREDPHAQVLLDGQRGEHVACLGYVSDTTFDQLVGGEARDVLAVENDAALTNRHQTEQGLDEGRLAGPVGPDDPDQLTLVERERSRAQDVDTWQVAGYEAFRLEQDLSVGRRVEIRCGVDVAHRISPETEPP